MTPRYQFQRIYAGNNGVYDAVFSEDSAEWFIRFWPYEVLRYTPSRANNSVAEFSVTGYPSAHDAKLAWERGQVTYRSRDAE